MHLARTFIIRQVERVRGRDCWGAMISRRPAVHRLNSRAAGFSRSAKGRFVISISRPPRVSASARTSFSRALMNGDTSTPPLAAM